MPERPNTERRIYDVRQIRMELTSALGSLNRNLALLQGSDPKEYAKDDLKSRLTDAIVKLSSDDRTGLKATLLKETTQEEEISRIMFNQRSGNGDLDRVTVTTYTDKGTVAPIYLEVEIAPIGSTDPNQIRRYQLARRDKL